MTEADVAPDQNPIVSEAFASAAIAALAELTQLEATIAPAPDLRSSALRELIAATMTLGRPIPGMMTLVLSEETASLLASRYLPPAAELTDEIVNDVAGEMANVIAGQAKTILKGTPYHFTLSPPAVARAPQLSQLAAIAEKSVMVSLKFDNAGLLLIVQLGPNM